jgi:glycosyltransferase involved in cell wall biosynthesis
MKVLFLPDYSGTYPYQRELADGLGVRGVDVRLAEGRGPLAPLAAVRNHGRPDVLHLHWLHGLSTGPTRPVTAAKSALALLQLAALRLAGVRIVLTAHNITRHGDGHPRLERRFRALVVRLCHGVICHCEDAVDAVLAAYDLPDRYRERFAVVPHGHYIDSYENDVSGSTARETLGVDGDPVFLYFGRVCSYKNVPELLEAFRALEAPGARLVVAGNPESPALRRRVEAAAARDDRVHADLRFVPPDEVQVFMNAADAVVLPFSGVLTSGSAMLGMSFGNALLVPDLGCVSALLSAGGGFGYDPDRPGGLRAVLSELLDADLDAAGRENRAAAADFDWGTIARDTHRVYRGTATAADARR